MPGIPDGKNSVCIIRIKYICQRNIVIGMRILPFMGFTASIADGTWKTAGNRKKIYARFWKMRFRIYMILISSKEIYKTELSKNVPFVTIFIDKK